MKEQAVQFAREHPRVIPLLTGALVVFASYNLARAVQLHERGRHLVAVLQREASEALGG